MIVAILSDIHDRVESLEKVLKDIKNKDIKSMLFLGDFVAPSTAEILFKTGLETWAIFGNNDGDKASILRKSLTHPKVQLSNTDWMGIKLGDKRVFLTHYPEIAYLAAKSGEYNAVFYGHNHIAKTETLDNGTLFANPGEIASTKTGKVTYIIWDTESGEANLIEL